jgi:hypothetical protein
MPKTKIDTPISSDFFKQFKNLDEFNSFFFYHFQARCRGDAEGRVGREFRVSKA